MLGGDDGLDEKGWEGLSVGRSVSSGADGATEGSQVGMLVGLAL